MVFNHQPFCAVSGIKANMKAHTDILYEGVYAKTRKIINVITKFIPFSCDNKIAWQG